VAFVWNRLKFRFTRALTPPIAPLAFNNFSSTFLSLSLSLSLFQ
jgi:hypothetical protein